MRPYDISALARALDPAVPTNRAIGLAVLALTAGDALTRRFRGDSWKTAWQEGLITGGATFGGWSLARELDPDEDAGAFVAAALAKVARYVWGRPSLPLTFAQVLNSRVVNRSTGVQSYATDTAQVFGAGALVAKQGYQPFALSTAAALAADKLLAGETPPQQVPAALVTGLLPLLRGDQKDQHRPDVGSWVILGLITAGFGALVWRQPHVSSRTDATGLTVLDSRVRAARGLTLATAWLLVMTRGAAGQRAASPLWAAMAGTALWRGARALGAPPLPKSMGQKKPVPRWQNRLMYLLRKG